MAMTETDEPGASAFDAATSATTAADGGTHALSIDPGWTVGTKPNGGYLLAAVARAAAPPCSCTPARPTPIRWR